MEAEIRDREQAAAYGVDAVKFAANGNKSPVDAEEAAGFGDSIVDKRGRMMDKNASLLGLGYHNMDPEHPE